MFRLLVRSLCCVVLVLCLTADSPAQYYQYYRDGTTFPLTPDDTLITLRIAGSYSDLVPQDVVNLVSQLSLSDFAEPIASDFYRYRVSGASDLESFLEDLRGLPQVEFVNPCFRTVTGDVICMSDEIIVTYRPEWSAAQIDSINTARGLSFVLPPDSTGWPYLIRCTPQSGDNTLRVSLDLIEDGVCLYAEPNFSQRDTELMIPNDEYYSQQWHHSNATYPGADLGSEKAWEITQGSPEVTVAVIDNGFEFGFGGSGYVWTHPDLEGLPFRDPWDYAGFDADIHEWQDGLPDHDSDFALWAHGTNVVGLISARLNNNTGVCGLAPLCTVMPIKYKDIRLETDDWTEMQSIKHTYQVADPPADILTCSWRVNGGMFSAQMDSVLEVAYHAGVTVFFAAGANDDTMSYPGYSQWVIGVGKTDIADTRGKGYPAGDSLDLCAPGVGLWSLDLEGTAGSNTGHCDYLDECCLNWAGTYDYTCMFSGTSASSPLAAGVAALVLSRRPDFRNVADRVKHLRDILYRSSVDLGDAGKDIYYGHGRVDALRALISVTRGDLNHDGIYNVLDVVLTVNEIYRDTGLQGLHPGHADVMCDGVLDVLDVVRLIDHTFRGGPLPDTCFVFDGYPSQ